MITFPFSAYKIMIDILNTEGLPPPFDYNRSTLHRWRVSGQVPAIPFMLCFYYFQSRLPVSIFDIWQNMGFHSVATGHNSPFFILESDSEVLL